MTATSTLIELTRPRGEFYLATSPYIPELVTQASSETELYPRLTDALGLIAKMYAGRQEELKLSEPQQRDPTMHDTTGEATSLVDLNHEGDRYLFTSEKLPNLRIEARDPFEGIQQLSKALQELWPVDAD